MQPSHQHSARSILIVDDSAFEQRVLMEMLSEHSYRISVAFNGLQGYQLALANQPDLILLDVRMPSMDGYTACRLLKANPATHHIPVIFLSGADGADERIMGLSIGGVDYVAKPFTLGELAARINVHLNLVQRASLEPESAAAEVASDPDAVIVAAAKRLIADSLATVPSLERIARSVQLLAETDISVQDIALLIGFNNAGNFATAFRERMGVTPSAYRQARQDTKTHH